MYKSFFYTVLLVGVIAGFASCSSTKYVEENEFLLNHVKVTTECYDCDINTTVLENYVKQKPNRRWFSLVKLPLATYSLSGRDSSLWINRLLKNMGEPPVIYDSFQVSISCNNLKKRLQNEGFLNAEVVSRVKTKGKKVDVKYVLIPGDPYFVNNIYYDIQDSVISSIIFRQGLSRQLISKGMRFDVEKLDAERKRLTKLLSDRGFFRFHKEYITYIADSLPGTHLVDLTLKLSPFLNSEQKISSHTRYWIRKIRYASGNSSDSSLHLRPSVLRECTHMVSNHPYSSAELQNTYNHFGRLQAVKYTNISFSHFPGTDSLDCDILLQTNKPSTISFLPEGTNTAGDLGAAASLTYTNRNFFHGSEVFTIQLRGAYEAIRELEGYKNQDFLEYSFETKLQFPRFLSPFVNRNFRRQCNATSELSLMYDMQNRPEFHRRLLSTTWRYRWNFPYRNDSYQLDVLDLNYVFMPWISDTFRNEYLDNDNNRNAILSYNYKDLFITKIGFGYTYNKGNTAFKTNIETSGNVLSATSRWFGAKKDEMGNYKIFNIAFAQYLKYDLDLSHSLEIDHNNQLVLHLGIGVAYPYGNSHVLPFEKRYFSGGANSVRGWSVRSLGPGKYKERDGRINFINQTGDIKLDLNAEYRTNLFWKFRGAIFIDAGNIWTIRDYNEQPGGQFTLKDFPSQIAVSYGMGLRLNFDYFILRFDLGMKAVNPAYEEEDDEHYPFLHPKLSRDFAFHFAVGLPF